MDPSSRLSAADCLSHPFLACTNYASFLNEKLIQLDQLSFAHEEREITIDILRAELLREGIIHIITGIGAKINHTYLVMYV